MHIDVYHDTACPWCRIGKAHLKAALEQWDGEAVTVSYHTYFLNPNIPDEGYPFKEYMNAKGGGQVPMEQWFARPREMGAQAGLTFNFDRITHAPNTLRSHQLIALAPDDKREAIMDAVYAAYFEHGRNIGDIDVLVDIAETHGMDADAIREKLENDAARQQVLSDAASGQQIGVQGVPFFVIDKRLAFSGAQPPDVIVRAMRQAVEMKAEETTS
jgi:predicted DsbA family dithiol-disulfide isomerase